jgi:hypothetical protein
LLLAQPGNAQPQMPPSERGRSQRPPVREPLVWLLRDIVSGRIVVANPYIAVRVPRRRGAQVGTVSPNDLSVVMAVVGRLASAHTTMRLGRIPPERFGPVLAFDRLKLGGGVTFVMMVQPTDFANFDHLTFGGRLSSEERGVFAERQMSAPVVVIGNIRREPNPALGWFERDRPCRPSQRSPNALRVVACDRPLVRRSRAAEGHTPQELIARRGHVDRGVAWRPVPAIVTWLVRGLTNCPA